MKDVLAGLIVVWNRLREGRGIEMSRDMFHGSMDDEPKQVLCGGSGLVARSLIFSPTNNMAPCPGCKECRSRTKPKTYEYPHERIDELEAQLASARRDTERINSMLTSRSWRQPLIKFGSREDIDAAILFGNPDGPAANYRIGLPGLPEKPVFICSHPTIVDGMCQICKDRVFTGGGIE